MRPMYFLVLSLSVGTLWLSSCNSVIREPEKSEPATHEIVLPYEPPTLKVIEPPPLPPVPAEVVFHGPRDTKKIALTFDACSTRQPSHYDERVTQVLVDKQVPATIFLGGKWIEENLLKKGKKFELVYYDSAPLAVMDVVNGRIIAAAMDDAPAKDAVKKQPVKIIGPFGMPDEQFGYGVRKEDTKLLEMLNAGLKKAMASPIWAEMKKKYELE